MTKIFPEAKLCHFEHSSRPMRGAIIEKSPGLINARCLVLPNMIAKQFTKQGQNDNPNLAILV